MVGREVLSLCSGIGGLDLGLQRAGWTIAGQVEIDPYCREVLARHWPEVPRHDDVSTAPRWWGRRTASLVCAGIPCQPTSLAGKGLAQSDPRWLWPRVAAMVRHADPRWVVVENPPGLLGRGFGDILRDLARLGYDCEWDCLPAALHGAPHLRNRVWLVAYRRRDRRDAEASDAVGDPLRLASPDGQAAAVAESDGLPGHVADAVGPGLAKRQGLAGDDGPQRAPAQRGRRVDDRRPVADAQREGLEGRPGQGHEGTWRPAIVFARRAHGLRGEWPSEPDLPRVAYGIPHRVERITALGNAVVPAAAEHVGRRIIEAEAAMR